MKLFTVVMLLLSGQKQLAASCFNNSLFANSPLHCATFIKQSAVKYSEQTRSSIVIQMFFYSLSCCQQTPACEEHQKMNVHLYTLFSVDSVSYYYALFLLHYFFVTWAELVYLFFLITKKPKSYIFGNCKGPFTLKVKLISLSLKEVPLHLLLISLNTGQERCK